VLDPKSLGASMLGGPQGALSERTGKLFVGLFLPANRPCNTAIDRWSMQRELTDMALALAAYRADHGSYPATLAELAPKYIAKVPKDIFNDADLHYKREAGGYLLYSVGQNGKDDGGKTREDDPPAGADWDDLVVRVPAKVK
jgi:hypothetical protein